MRKVVTNNEAETNRLGFDLGENLKPGDVVALYGELGVGKTALTKGMARGLGIQDRLLSPTFVLVREYDLPSKKGKLYHLDLYRLESAKELKSVNLEEMINEGTNMVVIEWADKAEKMLPKGVMKIKLTSKSDTVREIEIRD